jgi:hypothetical protein
MAMAKGLSESPARDRSHRRPLGQLRVEVSGRGEPPARRQRVLSTLASTSPGKPVKHRHRTIIDVYALLRRRDGRLRQDRILDDGRHAARQWA